jgi:hypothetical protein
VPGATARGAQWAGDYSFSLDQPILDFTAEQMLDDGVWASLKGVFEHWLRLENDNITRVRTGLLKARFPDPYRTNETWHGGWSWLSLSLPTEEQHCRVASQFRESLEWVGEHLRRRGDFRGAALAAMLHRHLNRDSFGDLSFVQQELNAHLGMGDYVYAGVDHLLALLDAGLQRA